MNIIKYFVFLFIFSSCVQASSEVSFQCSSKKEINLVFINGILNSVADASASMDELSGRSSSLSKDVKINSYLFYNSTDGFSDIVEAAIQIDREGASMSYYTKGINHHLKELFLQKPTFKEWFFDNITKNLDANTHQMIDHYDWLISSNKKPILLVAHSQGNLFANSIFQDATRRSKGEVLHVAPPSGLSYGPVVGHIFDINRMTNLGMNADGFLKYLDNLYNNPSLIINDGFMLFHEFLGVYLNGSMSGVMNQKLTEQIKATQRISLDKDKSKNTISFTLSWNNRRDLDLQVEEPSTHVYHWNPEGKIGKFSGDIKTKGSETYELACAKLTDGLKLGIATNTTIINGNGPDDALSPAVLTLNFAGNKTDLSWMPGWDMSFATKPSLYITFNKGKAEDEWIVKLESEGINNLTMRLNEIKKRIAFWNN